MSAGWPGRIPELVELAGGQPVCAGGLGERTPTLGCVAALLEERPDVVVFALCGFDIPRAVAELRACGLLADERWRAAGCAAYVMDGNALVNRSGPRLVESAEALAEAIHPALAGAFGHLGTPYLMALPDALACHLPPPPTSAAQPAPATPAPLPSPPPPSAPPAAAEGAQPVALSAEPPDSAAVRAVVQAQLHALACGGRHGVEVTPPPPPSPPSLLPRLHSAPQAPLSFVCSGPELLNDIV